MVVKKYLIFVFLLVANIAIAQENISNKSEQLNKIRSEINELEKEIGLKSRQEKESLQSLEKINRQNLLLSKLINEIQLEEKLKEREISELDSIIKKTEDEIEKIKRIYSNYTVWIYKNRQNNFWKFLLNAKSINQAVVRYNYFTYLTKKNKENIEKLKETKQVVANLKEQKQKEIEAKEQLLKEKEREQKVLASKQKEKKALLTELKKDKKNLEREIANKRNAEIAIKNLINKLIEEERINKTKEKERRLAQNKEGSKENTKLRNEELKERTFTEIDYDKFESFASLKGKLNWPVKSGTIIREFGENVNDKLNTVTLNYGIDIKTRESVPVYAVAEGIVSAVDWIPGFGSVVIITHSNNYRTVYGHVADLAVTEGTKVKRGTTIGSVNESLEGNILHFEIWNDRNYQNPVVWLSH